MTKQGEQVPVSLIAYELTLDAKTSGSKEQEYEIIRRHFFIHRSALFFPRILPKNRLEKVSVRNG